MTVVAVTKKLFFKADYMYGAREVRVVEREAAVSADWIRLKSPPGSRSGQAQNFQTASRHDMDFFHEHYAETPQKAVELLFRRRQAIAVALRNQAAEYEETVKVVAEHLASMG